MPFPMATKCSEYIEDRAPQCDEICIGYRCYACLAENQLRGSLSQLERCRLGHIVNMPSVFPLPTHQHWEPGQVVLT